MRKSNWLAISRWPEYEVSVNNGVQIRRVSPSTGTRYGKKLKLRLGPDGYMRITLCRNCKPKTFTVHALVAETFFGPRPRRAQVNHKDFNRSNNHPSNLEYLTPKENTQYTINNGRANRWHKLHVHQVRDIRLLYRQKKLTQDALASKFGVSRRNIGFIVHNVTWKAA